MTSYYVDSSVERLRVFDCFTFNKELDLLEFRLRLLSALVDKFVLVEAPRTHSGRVKPLHFAENAARFNEWASQIVHVVVSDLPQPTDQNRWIPESFQRNAILRGLSGAKPNDIILVTDVDEIPEPSVVKVLRAGLASPTTLQMTKSYFKANFIYEGPWLHPKAAPRSQLGEPHELRTSRNMSSVIPHAGHHLSYLADTAGIQDKYRAFAHSELDNDLDRSFEHIERCQRYAIDQIGRGAMFRQLQKDELHGLLLCAFEFNTAWFDFQTLPPEWRRRTLCRYSRWRRRSRYATPSVVELFDRRFETFAPVLAPVMAVYDYLVRRRRSR